MTPEISARVVATDPQWLPHTFGPDGSRLTSVFVPRAKHQELMFLTDDHYLNHYAKAELPADAVGREIGDAATAPLHFIFHTAFCCSTLMVKALDIPGRSVGLKEPEILINVANRIARSDDAANRQRLALVLRLLARPYAPGETVIVKPSNSANRIVLPALEMLPQARAVLMHSDLPTLLRSVAKRGMWGRRWARKVFRNVSAWSSLQLGYEPGELFELTDLQVAGLTWLMQVHHFGEVARRMGSRVMVLEGAELIRDPSPVLGRAAALFALELDEPSLSAIANGSVFSRHSKFAQRDYSVDAREAEHDAAVAAHGEEIDLVVKWVEAVAAHCGVRATPAGPLPA
ncbi:hypothetical protein [Sphingosinicella sp. CPCC 101087]|uniref:hypothetical protein n=1 Tax=Sphingosinicella sp. CPCC 101087 TaxID=2497754 RepID=UPI00101BA7D9|nr:hypothetical protein [Sphingosinicella sp. CPCC 101087]